MNYKIKYLAIFTLVTINSLTSAIVYGSEDDKGHTVKVVQLAKDAKSDILRANLAAGDDVLFKVNVYLEKGRRTYGGQGHIDFPARLFLTNGESDHLGHQDVNFTLRAHCFSSEPQVVLPTEKPESFKSYEAYSQWLENATLTSQVKVTFDTSIDSKELAPELIKHLPNNSQTSYLIMGHYEIDKTQIKPDQCLPTVQYFPNRDLKETTITLGGSLILDGTSYAFGEFKQQLPHHQVQKSRIDLNDTKKIICSYWIASSTELLAIQYQEYFPKLANIWPDAPTGAYWVKEYRPDTIKPIKFFSCQKRDTNVANVHSKIFIADHEEEIRSKESLYIKLNVKDENDDEFTVSYKMDENTKSRINKMISGYELACGMFLEGRLEYDHNSNKIELKTDKFKEETTNNDIAG